MIPFDDVLFSIPSSSIINDQAENIQFCNTQKGSEQRIDIRLNLAFAFTAMMELEEVFYDKVEEN
jgi:hypothetical protein